MSTTLTVKPLRTLLGIFDIGFYIEKITMGAYYTTRPLGFRASMYTLDVNINPVILWEFMHDAESGKVYKRGVLVH